MDRNYEHCADTLLLKKQKEITNFLLKHYIPKSKHRAFFELLEIERELTLREE